MITNSMTARLKPVQAGRASLVSVLDIGSTKISCIVARLTPRAEGRSLRARSHATEVIGFGYGASSGMKGGIIVDLKKAETAIRSVVSMAEKQAGLTIESVIVNVSGGNLGSQTLSASVLLGGQEVEKADLAKVLKSVNECSVQENRSIIHALPIGYSLDGQRGIENPCGMVGEKLGVDVAVISAKTQAMRNIELALNHCHIQVQALIATPYASALATLVDDEAQLGIACIDFGGANTTISVFSEGQLVHCDSLNIGGQDITLEIARQLSISIEDAERIKTFYASVLPGQLDERELIPITPIGAIKGEAPNAITRSNLNRIIRPKVEEILTLVRDRMASAGMMDVAGRRFVLTGGASEFTGLSELATRMLSRHVRVGRPLGIAGLPEMAKSPAFATIAGMLVYPQICHQEFIAPKTGNIFGANNGYFSRISNWLVTNFNKPS